MGAVRSRLRRWHVWLGWIVGLPVLVWTLSGVIMVWKPIEEVRGEHLLKEPAPIRMTAPLIPPAIQGVPFTSLELQPRTDGARWVITLDDGSKRMADPATGQLIPPLSAAEAAREVTARYTGSSTLASVSRTDADNPPLELRRPIAAWKVTMADGTNFYVDSGSGAVVARRTGWWRFYDLMWGLHIMDPKGREDMHNPFVIGFGIAAFLMSLLAIALLVLTRTKGRKKAPPLTLD